MFLINPYFYGGGGGGGGYLVDDYSLRSAHSLRKLAATTTNVIKARRSSDSAELDFTAEEITDGTLATWATGTNAFVTTLYQQGQMVSTSDLIQTTAANQPKIVTSGVVETKGGLPCLVFDGVNDSLSVVQQVYPSSGTAGVYFGVASSNANLVNNVLFGTNSGFSNGVTCNVDTRTATTRNFIVNDGSFYFGDLSTARNDLNQRLLVGLTDSSRNLSAFDNGLTGGTATFTSNYSTLSLHLGFEGSSNFLDGTFQELIIGQGDYSSDRVAIQDEINDYYSIY